MPSELLKTVFLQNEVDFRSFKACSEKDHLIIKSIPKQSQINYSILYCGNQLFIALNPATHKFDLSQLNKVTGKSLSYIGKKEEDKLNNQLLKAMPHNLKNGVHIFIDEALEYQDELFVVSENNNIAYAVELKQLHKLSSEELIGISFSEEIKINMDNNKTTLSFKERVKALHSLPPMPETASKILELRSIPDVKIEQIVEVIEKDPALVAQIVSYANSAFFGQAGSVKSLKDAIFRVLGVDAVLNMALALSVGSTFKMAKSGVVGAKAVWMSSVYAASLMQRLSMLMPWGERPNPGTAYLVGLLNDVGLLVIGHLFPDEHLELNDFIEKNEGINISEAEQQILGITHLEVGKIVMRMWNMPEELISVAEYFSNKGFSDEYEKYIELLSIVKTLLIPHGLAFGGNEEGLPLDSLDKLSLDEEEVIVAADEVLSEGEVIKNLAKQMCA